MKLKIFTLCFVILQIVAVFKLCAKDNIVNKMIYIRGVETAVWGMPLVGMREFYKGIKRIGGDWNDIVYYSMPITSRHKFLTPNNQTPYVIAALNSAKGPIVLELPDSFGKIKIYGSLVDCWDYPFTDVGSRGADKGKGGKYLLLPPDSKMKIYKKGYYVFKPNSHAVYMALRLICLKGTTLDEIHSYVKSIKVYYYNNPSSALKTKYIDGFNIKIDTLPKYNISFYKDISEVINEEPVLCRDISIMGVLSGIGIEKGKKFNPDKVTTKILTHSIKDAYKYMQWLFINRAFKTFYKNSYWSNFNLPLEQVKLGWPFFNKNKELIDERAEIYHIAILLPKRLGKEAYYLVSLYDSNGKFFNATSTYKLHIPAKVPVKYFWSAVVYSFNTHSFISNAKSVGVSSLDKNLVVNKDGSVDIYFSPTPLNGKNVNWIETGERFWVVMRFYGPEKEFFTKKWILPDIEKIR